MTYPALGEILAGSVRPKGGCCDHGPSYTCYECGQPAHKRTIDARIAAQHYRLHEAEKPYGWGRLNALATPCIKI